MPPEEPAASTDESGSQQELEAQPEFTYEERSAETADVADRAEDAGSKQPQVAQQADQLRADEGETDQFQSARSEQAGFEPATMPVDQMGESDHRASNLIGASVVDAKGMEVGSIDDLVVSPEDGEVQAVLSIDGILGFGDKLVAIPIDEIDLDPQADRADAEAAGDDAGADESDAEKDRRVGVALTAEQLLESEPEFRYREDEDTTR